MEIKLKGAIMEPRSTYEPVSGSPYTDSSNIEKSIQIDNRPNDILLAHLCHRSYQPEIGIGRRAAEFKIMDQTWWVLKKLEDPASGYRGILFLSENKQAVLVHRGTNSLLAWKEDMIGIALNQLTAHQEQAYKFAKQCVEWLKDKIEEGDEYSFCISGHSLGGYLADLSLFWYQKDFGFPNVSVVTFENPGTYSKIAALYPKEYDKMMALEVKNWDVTTYLSYPNIINTFDTHMGTIYHVHPKFQYTPPDILAQVTRGIKLTLLKVVNPLLPEGYQFPSPFTLVDETHTYQAHSMESIIEALSPQFQPPFQLMNRWPLGIVCVKKFLERCVMENGQYVQPDPQLIDEVIEHFRRSYQEEYEVCSDARKETVYLGLRHFQPPLREYLKRFYKTHRASLLSDESRQRLIGYWSSKEIPSELIKCLINFKIEKVFNESFLILTGKIEFGNDSVVGESKELSAKDFRYIVSAGLNKLTTAQCNLLQISYQEHLSQGINLELTMIEGAKCDNLKLENATQCFGTEKQFFRFLTETRGQQASFKATMIKDVTASHDIVITNARQRIIEEDNSGFKLNG